MRVTRGELALAAGAALLAGALLAGLSSFRELLERAHVENTVRHLRTGLRLAVAERILQGREREIGALAGSNPVELLSAAPHGYAGERQGEDASVAGGSWYFDRASRELAYVPQRSRHLERQGRELRWSVQGVKEVPATADDRMVQGVILRETRAYRWFRGT